VIEMIGILCHMKGVQQKRLRPGAQYGQRVLWRMDVEMNDLGASPRGVAEEYLQ
jgi:hypothetical protein